MSANKRPAGCVLYHGPSVLDGAPTVAIATGIARRSSNKKTGDMIQVWILRADMSPIDAIHAAKDVSICGYCPHRNPTGGFKGRSCYVNITRAPTNIWKAWERGGYPQGRTEWFAGRNIRVGAYGDPAALPKHVLENILTVVTGVAAYTHQWTSMGPGRAEYLREWCMASCDSVADLERARAAGWRTFRVAPTGAPRVAAEKPCPAANGNKSISCAACLGCGGARNGKGAGFMVHVHGSNAAVANFKRFAA